jgi:hypothetical protein
MRTSVASLSIFALSAMTQAAQDMAVMPLLLPSGNGSVRSRQRPKTRSRTLGAAALRTRARRRAKRKAHRRAA